MYYKVEQIRRSKQNYVTGITIALELTAQKAND